MKLNEVDWKFRNYVAKNMERGDKMRVQAILGLSYPTLQKHLTGSEVNPAIQAQIVEFYERRRRNRSMAMNYVSKRLEQVDGEIVPIEQTPSITDMISLYEEGDNTTEQDQ
jgi:hypothetical protein